MTDTHTEPTTPAPDLPFKTRRRASGRSWSVTLAVLFLLLALLLGAGLWFQQKRFESAGREIAGQTQAMSNQLIETRRDARQAMALVDSHANRIAQLELSLRDAQSQFAEIELAWQTFNKGMEDSMLANDLDRLVTLASQQLRLAGNVNNAVMALETALTTLVRQDRPRFAAVQRAINTDLERLRAVPIVDVPALAARLDTLITLTGRAPLLVPDAAAPNVARSSVTAEPTVAAATPDTAVTPDAPPVDAATEASSSWWSRALGSGVSWLWQGAGFVARELASVIRVQRVSDANALLMSPEQGSQLRANLRTRLLTAQMALLMRQSSLWRSELAAVESTLVSRYDPQSVDTGAALKLVHDLAAVPVTVQIPDITDSLIALETVRAAESPSIKGGD